MKILRSVTAIAKHCFDFIPVAMVVTLVIPSEGAPMLFPAKRISAHIYRHDLPPCTRDMNHDEITGRSMSNHNILVGKYCGVDLGTVIDSIPKIPFKLFCIRYPCTFNSRREFSETPRRIRPPSELANALYVSHRLSGNLSLAFFASIQLSSRSSLTSDSERPAKEINSITSEFATLYAFPPVYRHFIRLSASLPPLYTPFRQFFILGKPSHVRAASPPHLQR